MQLMLGLLTALASPAHAESPAPEDAPSAVASTLEGVDGAFTTMVDALSSVMFFDLVLWDNTVSGEAAVGLEVNGERVTAATGAGLEWRTVYRLNDAERHVDAAVKVVLGDLKAVVSPGPAVEPATVQGRTLIADIPAQPVDLAKLGLTPIEGEPAEGEPIQVIVTELAPIPVRVDRQAQKTVPSKIRIAPASLPLSEGDRVRTPSGDLAAVVALTDDGLITALSTTPRIDDGPAANPHDVQVPFIVAWLVFGAVFFTLRMAFVNVRLFGHAIAVTTGRYHREDAEGEFNHLQALSTLSASVGLGNIAGVAIAVSVGGPGAVVWMVVAGFLGMSLKFVECTLGQMYRIKRPDGSVSGGPMHYLDDGLRELGMGTFGKVLAVLFAVMCIGGSLGGGNMFQAHQSSAAVLQVLSDANLVADASAVMPKVMYSLILAFLVGLVIIGGIRGIGAAAGVIVPFMCGLYVLAGVFILLVHAADVPAAFGQMLSAAFSFEAGLGGFAGVLMQGFRRAAFSNEAGVGSASIAHSAATTAYPVREGIVALLEPFIDTIVVCTMTGLVVVVTGAYLADTGDGVVMTQAAFGSVISWFPVVLSVAVVLFAFSTMISWSDYGERCAVWLFGDGAKLPYRLLFLVCVFLGATFNLGAVLDFSDLMVLGMAFPNILGALFLSSKVRAALDDYVSKLRSGAFDVADSSGRA